MPFLLGSKPTKGDWQDANTVSNGPIRCSGNTSEETDPPLE